MIPVVCDDKEITNQRPIIDRVYKEVSAKYGKKLAYTVGTMIENPRAAINSAKIAAVANFTPSVRTT